MPRSETCGRFSVCLLCQKNQYGLWDMHTIRFESMRPIVPHLPECEYKIVTYVNCLISDIAAHGAAFFVKQMPKTLDFQKPAPKLAKDKMYRNVKECITLIFQGINI